MSRGTLPAGTVVTGGIFGAGWACSLVSVVLRGGAFGAGAVELGSSAGLFVSGADSSAPGRGLGGGVGGMGRVAEGASGISSGFCWAHVAVANTSIPAKSAIPLVFFISGARALPF